MTSSQPGRRTAFPGSAPRCGLFLSFGVAVVLATHLSVRAEERAAPPKNFTNGIGMKFAWIPPGDFLMGSPPEEKHRLGSEVRHKVTLTRGFYMGVHLVTQEQWQEVMGKNPSQFTGEQNLPVDTVSWRNCQEFIKKLQEKEPDKRAYRLPTEAEWEYACRAGTTTPFHVGDTISTSQANYDGSFAYGGGTRGINRGKTTPVGTFPANAWGLHDMHGNLWQWCQDIYGDYPKTDATDPQGADKGDVRVIRGGTWYFGPSFCRSASRDGCSAGISDRYYGFRLAFFPKTTTEP